MPTKHEKALIGLDMSLMAVKITLATGGGTLAERLTWAAGELERLAGEAYNLADECEDPCREPIPGFDPERTK
jgi:hypothetical protein